jgi:hypothetical protein
VLVSTVLLFVNSLWSVVSGLAAAVVAGLALEDGALSIAFPHRIMGREARRAVKPPGASIVVFRFGLGSPNAIDVKRQDRARR